MKFFKKNKNELLKLLIFIIMAISVFYITKIRLKREALWPYEKNTRLIIITFTFVFLEYSIYYVMKKSDKFIALLYRLLPAVLLVSVFLFIPEKIFKVTPFLLPLVLIYFSYGIINTIIFQTFIMILYYFTGQMTVEVLIMYMLSFVVVFFFAKYTVSHSFAIMSFILSVTTYFIVNLNYQYMTYEKIKVSSALIGLIPFIISVIPLYFRYILIGINNRYLKNSLKNICDDENELLLMLMKKNENVYLHSLQVADTSVRVAKMVGADMNLVKAGGRFHEIGKLKSNNYVSAGIDIMKANKFPKEVINIVKEHNSKSNIPRTLESAIVMLSDSIENTLETIIVTKGNNFNRRKIVENIIDIRFDTGMLDIAIKDIDLYKKLRKAYLTIYS